MSIYLLDKKAEITSNKALSLFKRELNVKKAGFSGVLDPFATGLLIIATDGDTRFLDLFLNSEKTYTGKILFGKTTDTLDIDGEVIEEMADFNIDETELRKVISEKFTGPITQTPPNFSNIKVDGKRAHELSRRDIEFELKPVERNVHSFEIEKHSDVEYSFEVTVSSGTYIRSLARDIGKEINVPAMLTELRRTSIGNINVPEDIIEVEREEIIPLPFMSVNEQVMNELLNGKVVEIENQNNELVVKDTERYIWIRSVSENKYKIHKNIK